MAEGEGGQQYGYRRDRDRDDQIPTPMSSHPGSHPSPPTLLRPSPRAESNKAERDRASRVANSGQPICSGVRAPSGTLNLAIVVGVDTPRVLTLTALSSQTAWVGPISITP